MSVSRVVYCTVLFLMVCGLPGLAQDSEEDAEGGGAASRSLMPAEPSGTEIPLDTVRLFLNGYLRPMYVFETQDFGELGPPERERYTAIGARTKLMLDGRLEHRARFYTEYILDFNEVDQGTDTASTESENGRIKMIESYVDLFGTDSYWRVGSQIQYWGWFNGFWKPTNRLNATDGAFKNRETKDGKLPETGLEWVNRFGEQYLSLIYIPLPKVNKLSPNQIGFLQFLGYAPQSPDADSSNGKYVARAYGAFGALDYQLSYIDGLNPRADFANDGYVENEERVIEQAVDGRTVYHRYRSPGLDLRYRTGPADWKLGAVYYDTGDSGGGEDPLRQNSWYEWFAGPEIRAWGNTFDIHYGQIVVPDLAFEEEFDPNDAERKRLYFQNGLLGQPQDFTHVVNFKYRRGWFGSRLALSQDFEWYWDDEWRRTRLAIRTDLVYFFNPEKTLAARIRPGYFINREIETKEMMAEVQFDF